MAGWMSGGPDVFAHYRQDRGGAEGGGRGERWSPRGRRGEGGDEGHRFYVDLIKQGQRSSPEWRENWWAYCEEHMAAKDPALSDTNFLRTALKKLGLPQDGRGGRRGGGGGGRRGRRGDDHDDDDRGEAREQSEEHAELAEELNELQRSRPKCRHLWRSYCDENGDRNYDPLRHDPEFLEEGIRYLRRITDRPAGSEGREVDEMVSEVKALQRESASFVDHWRGMCDEEMDGYYDPSRVPAEFLERALRTWKRGGGGG
eukprot:Hpha_TRINITY_DN13467_c0_g1::TRINITY_DN13467_c0_g1_i1::g.131254::m.131254